MLPLVNLAIPILLFVISLSIVRNYFTKLYFESNGVAYLGSGTLRSILNCIQRKSFLDETATQYSKVKCSGKSIGVSFEFGMKTFTVTDPNLIQSIMIRDFDHFVDRRHISTGASDTILQRSLMMSQGDTFKAMRSQLAPIFTSRKLKGLFHIVEKAAENMVRFLETRLEGAETNNIDLTESVGKYTAEIIALSGCGIDSQEFRQKSPTTFREMVDCLEVDFSWNSIAKLFSIIFLPRSFVTYFQIGMVPTNVLNFFSNTIKSSIMQKAIDGETREDFVQFMVEAREKEHKKENVPKIENGDFKKPLEKKSLEHIFDDEGIIANSILLILAGSDTVYSLLLFFAYEMALNQIAQDTLRTEINAAWEEKNGQINYITLNNLTYLDMVYSETLRMYTPVPMVDRQCTVNYTIPEINFSIKEGDVVNLPFYALHHDSEHFPEPERFDPERFSAGNKINIKPYTYLPFGQGLRSCIGMGFAQIQAKLAIVYIVRNFKIKPCAKTTIPMKYTMTMPAKPKYGMQLCLSKIF